MKKHGIYALAALLFGACQEQKQQEADEKGLEATADFFEVADEKFFDVVPRTISFDTLSSGHKWTEGPLWVPSLRALLFADIPVNTVFKWKEGEGVSEYLKPSGHTGEASGNGEPGANGLLLNSAGQLVLCQHGDRRLAILDAPLASPEPRFSTLTDRYDGMRFNSPNDACFHSNGSLYFTDPAYGLPKQMDDPGKETPFQGVYRLDPDGKVSLLLDSITRPNGIAFLPGEQQLIIANSDPKNPCWYRYDVNSEGNLENGTVFRDASEHATRLKGMPDGLKVDSSGHVFATGPGGLWVMDSQGALLGIVKTGQPTANVCFGDDEKTLFLTANMFVFRLRL